MPLTHGTLPDVYSAVEIARAAGVRRRDVRALVESGVVRSIDGQFFDSREAIRAVRQLTGHATAQDRPIFRPALTPPRSAAFPMAMSGTVHAAIAGMLLLMTTMGLARPAAPLVTPDERKEARLVFLALPGPGGGGGGGGRREPTPAAKAERKGLSTMRSPVPIRRPPPPVEPPKIMRVSDPPPVKAEPLPPVVAPVIAVAADIRDRVGVPVDIAPVVESHGPGTGNGAGTGRGTGLGEGEGAGVGPGSGGGTGGGPYRPGSGITPPRLLREVRPDYTEDGRRRNVEGDVMLEIVVRRDGAVGDVKLVQGLGAGLDQRAIEAVRQWRFSPAQRQGVAVDVIVEVAVEFKLR
jgi:periplasmic protein TonB